MAIIYTWRGLRIANDPNTTFDLRWDWYGWDHAANERDHILGAASLWRKVYPGNVIEPIIEALREKRLEECHADLQRLADQWKSEFIRVLGLPRVLFTRAFSRRKASNNTSVLIFVSEKGLVFIARAVNSGLRKLSSFYFAESIVSGCALFPEKFERNAVEHYATLYSSCNAGRLPSRNNRNHFVERRFEIDRQICFEKAKMWGFESEKPGARWVGFHQIAPWDRPLGDVDPIPRKTDRNTDDGEGE